LARILNFTQTPSCRNFLYQIANFCHDVLIPENLAKHLRDKVKVRKATLGMNKQTLDEFRKMMSATVLQEELQ